MSVSSSVPTGVASVPLSVAVERAVSAASNGADSSSLEVQLEAVATATVGHGENTLATVLQLVAVDVESAVKVWRCILPLISNPSQKHRFTTELSTVCVKYLERAEEFSQIGLNLEQDLEGFVLKWLLAVSGIEAAKLESGVRVTTDGSKVSALHPVALVCIQQQLKICVHLLELVVRCSEASPLSRAQAVSEALLLPDSIWLELHGSLMKNNGPGKARGPTNLLMVLAELDPGTVERLLPIAEHLLEQCAKTATIRQLEPADDVQRAVDAVCWLLGSCSASRDVVFKALSMWPQVERMALDMLQRFARRKSVYHNPGLSVAVDEGGDDGSAWVGAAAAVCLSPEALVVLRERAFPWMEASAIIAGPVFASELLLSISAEQTVDSKPEAVTGSKRKRSKKMTNSQDHHSGAPAVQSLCQCLHTCVGSSFSQALVGAVSGNLGPWSMLSPRVQLSRLERLVSLVNSDGVSEECAASLKMAVQRQWKGFFHFIVSFNGALPAWHACGQDCIRRCFTVLRLAFQLDSRRCSGQASVVLLAQEVVEELLSVSSVTKDMLPLWKGYEYVALLGSLTVAVSTYCAAAMDLVISKMVRQLVTAQLQDEAAVVDAILCVCERRDGALCVVRIFGETILPCQPEPSVESYLDALPASTGFAADRCVYTVFSAHSCFMDVLDRVLGHITPTSKTESGEDDEAFLSACMKIIRPLLGSFTSLWHSRRGCANKWRSDVVLCSRLLLKLYEAGLLDPRLVSAIHVVPKLPCSEFSSLLLAAFRQIANSQHRAADAEMFIRALIFRYPVEAAAHVAQLLQ